MEMTVNVIKMAYLCKKEVGNDFRKHYNIQLHGYKQLLHHNDHIVLNTLRRKSLPDIL